MYKFEFIRIFLLSFSVFAMIWANNTVAGVYRKIFKKEPIKSIPNKKWREMIELITFVIGAIVFVDQTLTWISDKIVPDQEVTSYEDAENCLDKQCDVDYCIASFVKTFRSSVRATVLKLEASRVISSERCTLKSIPFQPPPSPAPPEAALPATQTATVEPPIKRPPPPPISRFESLRHALVDWQDHGIDAPAASRMLLSGIKDDDRSLFADDAEAWEELMVAHDVLNAPQIGLSAATLGRLPIHVESNGKTNGEDQLIDYMVKQLKGAGAVLTDEHHAAILLELTRTYVQNKKISSNKHLTQYRNSVSVLYSITQRDALGSFDCPGPSRELIDGNADAHYEAIRDTNYATVVKFLALLPSSGITLPQ